MPKEFLLPVIEPHQPFSGNSLGLLGYRSGPGDKSPPYLTPVSNFLNLLPTPPDEDTEVRY